MKTGIKSEPQVDLGPALERVTQLAVEGISLLKELVNVTAAKMGGGIRSNQSCVICVDRGVHRPELKCVCPCHRARFWLGKLGEASGD